MKKKEQGGTTSNALLGLLTLCPMSGYDMRGMIDRSIGHFWSESYGQIYPALKTLEKQGLVEKRIEQKEGRPDRNVFSITPDGRERLEEWLRLPAAVEVPRSELLLKLFFGYSASSDVNREHLWRFKKAHEGAVVQYAAMEKQLVRDEPNDPQLPYWLMTLSFGKHRSEAFVAWAQESLKKLDALEKRAKRKSAAKK
jgi:DNA-binding PadR family transcriptional regulator